MNRLSLFVLLIIVSASLSACNSMRKFEVQSEKRKYQRMSDRIGMSRTVEE